jgi:hypothetical protein
VSVHKFSNLARTSALVDRLIDYYALNRPGVRQISITDSAYLQLARRVGGPGYPAGEAVRYRGFSFVPTNPLAVAQRAKQSLELKMGRHIKASAKSNIPPAAAGTHVAILTAVVYLGMQPGWGTYEPQQKVILTFELPGERRSYKKNGVTIDTPQQVWRTFGVTLGKKSGLRKFLAPWVGGIEDGSDVDLESLLDKVGLLTVVHSAGNDERVYANCEAIVPLPKEMTAADYHRAGERIYFDPDDPATASMLNKLPEWQRKKIDSRLIEESPAEEELPAELVAGELRAEAMTQPRAPETTVDQELNDAIPF